MKGSLKELISLRPTKWKQTIVFLIVFTIFCSIIWYTGYDMGYFDATGKHPNFKEVVVSVPPETTTSPSSTITNTIEDAAPESYSKDFDCLNIAIATVNELESVGINSTVVGMKFADGGGHAVIVVPTSDRGWIYKEPQTGATMIIPVVGELYDGRRIVEMKARADFWIPIDEFYKNPVLVVDESWLEEEEE